MKYVIGILILLFVTSCGLIENIEDQFAGKSQKAWIYKHYELGTYLYCDAEQTNPRDYQFLGTGDFDPSAVERCSLAKDGQ